jgi:DNA-binding NarL/FixJ family response regulator
VNILAVTDQTQTLELMNSVARVAFPGATIRAAATLASAQSSAKSMAGLDMVLLDLELPDSEGLDGLWCFRADFPQAKVVIVSSRDAPELMADALDLGASGFIVKSLGISVPALRLVAQGGTYNPAVLATPLSPITGTGS